MVGVHRLTIHARGADEHDAPARAEVVFLAGELDEQHRGALTDLLVDPLLQTGTWDVPTGDAVEVVLHPGVADDVATAMLRACEVLGIPAEAAAGGRRIELADDGSTNAEEVARIAADASNPVIERWARGAIATPFDTHDATPAPVEVIHVRTLDDAALAALGAERGLALDPAELVAVRDHFVALDRDPTDAELETLAQTWSEHCAHKTFRAAITTADGDPVEPLLAQLRECTRRIAAPFVRSAFVGNAGIISFTDGVALSIKAETHNHPSAIEPFGGANTGVGGVIRDVMGTGHRPIAATDVLCFGPHDTPPADVPAGSLHPARVRDGVIAGVADYGNKIGLATVAGAVVYDPGYVATPLVFCGCIGVGPDVPLPDRPEPGDRVVVIGGRTGRDGIRGATFSSATMDATTGEVAGASVQIGNPITEKLVVDVLDGAQHLYRAITDCGAGGLSSAIGEMAADLGADVDLAGVPLKYPGLAPWEVWLSEAQERMVLAVPPADLDALAARCARHGVEMTDLGAFTSTGRLVVRHGRELVVDLDVGFLHDGRPRRSMVAELPTPRRAAPSDTELASRPVLDVDAALLALLAHPNIASKAEVVHRYDHEIGGMTAVRPLAGVAGDGPSDGVVLAAPSDSHGVAIGIGVSPRYGRLDAEAMAHAVVDEAIRNAVAAGADPERIALLDNFAWGDPRRPSTLGELVAAVSGCCAAAEAHGSPYVSGKDSLNNEHLGTDGIRHAVPPTLVITAVGHVPDVSRCPGTDLARTGDALVLLGRTRAELGGSHLGLVAPGHDIGPVPQPDPGAPARYRALHRAIRDGLVVACHDLSEGGLAVAVAEMAIGGRLGATVTALPHDDPVVALFAESTGRLLVEVDPGHLDRFLRGFAPDEAMVVGYVGSEPVLHLPEVEPVAVADLVAAFHGSTR